MCLFNFIKFEQIEEENALMGYRNWRLSINEALVLKSESQEYTWLPIISGPHEVLESNSGIYAYNYNYNNYYYNNNNYYYNNYNISGIIKQYGKTAIHKIGQRSEYAKIDKLFTIRLSDAIEEERFLAWAKEFNTRIEEVAKLYEASTISWQDFIEEINKRKVEEK